MTNRSVLGAALVEIDGDDSKLSKSMDGAKTKAQGLGKVMQTALGTAAGFAAAQVGMQGMSAGFDFLIGNAMDFEAALDGVQAATGASESAMADMRKEALRIGKDTSKSASEAVEAMGELAKAGMDVETILNGGADAAVALAEATGIDVPRAAVLVSNALNTWKDSGMDASDAANIFAKAANASAISVDDLGLSLAAVGPVASAAGLTMEDFAVAMGLMGNNAMRGSDAGTSLKAMLAGLTPVSDKAKDSMAELGFNAFDAAGNFLPMPQIIENLEVALRGMTEEQRAATLELWFGSDGVRAANVLLKEGVVGWNDFTQAMADAPDVAEQARIRMDNLKGDIERLKGSLETLSITIGSVLLPILASLAEDAIKVVEAILRFSETKEVQEVIRLIGEGLKAIDEAGGGATLEVAGFGAAILIALPALAALALIIAPGAAIVLGLLAAAAAVGIFATDLDKLPTPLLNVRQKLLEWRLEILNLAEDLTTVFGIELPGVGDRIDDNIRKTEEQIAAVQRERDARERQSEALRLNAEAQAKATEAGIPLKDIIFQQWQEMTKGETPRGKLNDDLALLYERFIAAGGSGEELGLTMNRTTQATSDMLPPLEEGARLSDNLAEAAMGVTQAASDEAWELRNAAGAGHEAHAGFMAAAEGEDSISNRAGAAIGAMQNIAGAAREAGGAARDAAGEFSNLMSAAVSAGTRAVEQAMRARDAVLAAQQATPPGYASGGIIRAGELSIVGERGWEPFIPAVDGRILSHEDAMQAFREAISGGGSSGGQGVEVFMPNATVYAQDAADALRSAQDFGYSIEVAMALRGASR